jgi:hypothetical protein
VRRPGRQAHRARQVGRAHEQRVDSVDGGDGFQVASATSVSICTITDTARLAVVKWSGASAEQRGAAHAGHAAHALRRVARGGHRLRGLGGGAAA